MDIDILEGAELDALVAERVMGWHLNTVLPEWLNVDGHLQCDIDRWRPSADWAPSKTLFLLRKALEDEYNISQISYDTKTADYFVLVNSEWSSIAPTLPLALCRALVKAYMDKGNE